MIFKDFDHWLRKINLRAPLRVRYRSVVTFNPLNASVALLQNPVNWFAQQVRSLVWIWGQYSYQRNNSEGYEKAHCYFLGNKENVSLNFPKKFSNLFKKSTFPQRKFVPLSVDNSYIFNTYKKFDPKSWNFCYCTYFTILNHEILAITKMKNFLIS